MNTEDFIKKHLNFSDRDLEYRPIFKYWQTLELMEEYHQAKLKLLGIGDVSNRFDSKYTPPFRVGRKQGKAVLDANGIEVVFFKNSEEQAREYCDYLNGC